MTAAACARYSRPFFRTRLAIGNRANTPSTFMSHSMLSNSALSPGSKAAANHASMDLDGMQNTAYVPHAATPSQDKIKRSTRVVVSVAGGHGSANGIAISPLVTASSATAGPLSA